MKGTIKAEDHEQIEARRRARVSELRRLASRILEWLDEERGTQASPNARQPLHVLLQRHFDGSRRELRLLKEGVSAAVRDERDQSVYTQRCLCAEIGLACALDAAQLDPSEARRALESSPFAGEDILAVLLQDRHAELMHVVISAADYLDGLHELDAMTAALQNRHEMDARNANSAGIRGWNEGVADTMAELKAVTAVCKALATKLKIASSPKPDVRRELGVRPLIGLAPLEFDRAVNDLLWRLKLGKVDMGVLCNFAYGGQSDPPNDPARSLEKRLDRIEEQRRAPEKNRHRACVERGRAQLPKWRNFWLLKGARESLIRGHGLPAHARNASLVRVKANRLRQALVPH